MPFLPLAIVGFFIQTGFEELYFRGYIEQLTRKYTKNLYLVIGISAVPFASMHVGNVAAFGRTPLTILPYLLFALTLRWVAWRTGSLAFSMGLHFANNLFAALFVVIKGDVIPSIAPFVYQSLHLSSAIVFAIGQTLITGYGRPAHLRRLSPFICSGTYRSMKNRRLLVTAALLLCAGVLGFATLLLVSPLLPDTLGGVSFFSNGQRVYYTGQDADGRVIPRTVAGGGMMGFGMMGSVACVDCHGEDSRGGRVGMMYGAIDIPDIRYPVLTSARSQDGTTVPAWTDSDIARAIRDGVEPNGQPLKAPMPRWDMTDSEVNDVISYLKELSTR